MDYNANCAMCRCVEESYRIIHNDEYVYSIVPKPPIREGHTLVLPKRHTTIENLNPDELLGLTAMLYALKERMILLYPETPPIIATLTDTEHSSIRDHFHYHIIPSSLNMRGLMAASNQVDIPLSELSELERMATILRGS